MDWTKKRNRHAAFMTVIFLAGAEAQVIENCLTNVFFHKFLFCFLSILF